MAIRVGINGFGRIGRLVFRILAARNDEFEVLAINDLTDTKTLAMLLKYDSTHRRFNGTVKHDDNALVVNGKRIEVLKERDPAKLPWGKIGADVVRGKHRHLHRPRRCRQRQSPATTRTSRPARRRSSSAPRPKTSPT